MYQDNKICYLSENPVRSNDAGNKARKDIDQVLKEMDFMPISHFNLQPNGFKSKFKHMRYILQISYIIGLLKMLNTRAKTLILQYPFYFERIENNVLNNVIRRNNTILLVHDIDSLRFPINVNGINKINLQRVEKDKAAFDAAKVVIVHNKKMKDVLEKWGIRTPIIELEVFDYLLTKGIILKKRTLGPVIAYAGNLSKSIFFEEKAIQELKVDFNLYGSNYKKDNMPWANVHYKGSFSSEDIPYLLEGNFGLIWDGTSIKECDGWNGKYMRYNNPHKLSLYISAGLPVITWKQAAIADFIKKYNIGFCIDNLEEINEKISCLTEEKYQVYQKNINKLQPLLANGHFTKMAITKAIRLLENR